MAQGINTDRMFDKRVVQRNIRTGRATKDEYAAFMSSLPDLTQQIRPADDGGDDDGFDVREARAHARAAAPRPSSPFADAPRPAAPPAEAQPAPAPPAAPAPAAPPAATAAPAPTQQPTEPGPAIGDGPGTGTPDSSAD
jgi:hypothetical protein